MKQYPIRSTFSLLLVLALILSCLPVVSLAASIPVIEMDHIRDTAGNNTGTGIETGTFKDTNGNTYYNALRFSVVYNKQDLENYRRLEYVDYQLSEQYAVFSGTIACGAGSEPDARMSISFGVDGEIIYEAKDITYNSIIPFEVNVEKGKVIRIACNTSDDDYGYCIVSGSFHTENRPAGITSNNPTRSGKRLSGVACIYDNGQRGDSYFIQYSDNGSISSVTSNLWNNGLIQELAVFDDQGRITSTTCQGDGTKTWTSNHYVYDNRGRLTREYTEGGDQRSAGAVLKDTTYSYNASGQMIRKEVTTFDHINGTFFTDKYTYEYNNAGLLTTSVYRPQRAGTWTFRECTFAYDNRGNLLEETTLYGEDIWTNNSSTPRIHEYASSRTVYSYDSNGKLTEKLQIATGFTYNYTKTRYLYFDGFVFENHQYGDFDSFSLDKQYDFDAFMPGVHYGITDHSNTVVLLNPETGEPVYSLELADIDRIVTKSGYITTLEADGYHYEFTYEG